VGDAAAQIHDAAARRVAGEFARPNFPEKERARPLAGNGKEWRRESPGNRGIDLEGRPKPYKKYGKGGSHKVLDGLTLRFGP
jgi:hypothetical protein